MTRTRETHINLLSIVGDWFPNIIQSLDRFFANCSSVSPRTWKDSREFALAYVLYNIGSHQEYVESLNVIKKGFLKIPEDRESGWKDEQGVMYIDFSITGRRLHELYFSNMKKVLGTALTS